MHDPMLLCVSHVKEYIKHIAPVERPGWTPTQVSEEAILALNEKLKFYIRQSLRRHPARGQTFREVL